MSPRIFLVRHGRTGTMWDGVSDPPLNDEGLAQARGLASRASGERPRALLTSPFLRARQTVAPLEQQWWRLASIEAALGEVPSPREFEEGPRVWLDGVLDARWADLSPEIGDWRDNLVALALRQREDVVMFTHFLNIVALYSVATGDDEVSGLAPAHCEFVEFEGGDELRFLGVRDLATGGPTRTD